MSVASDRGRDAGGAGRWFALSLAAFALIAAWLFLVASLADRRATLAQGWTDAENTAALLAQQANRLLRIAELTAGRAARLSDHVNLEDLRGANWTDLEEIAAGAPEVQAIWVVDATGRLVASSLDRRLFGLPLDTMPYFPPLRRGEASHVTSLLHGAPGGGWHFAWGRPLRGADGQFRGAVLAAIAAEEFGRVVEDLAPGQAAVLQLSRLDGTLVARWPLAAAGNNDATPASPALESGVREVRDADGT
ncbi:hypothetical protein, partial [Falsiroseomonas sp.]|uniref:PDC sensor domain-containing protein n=1 Tax=Falsiroseomonas sp. TaxID=2870721 RepID=UPI002726C53C